MGQQLLVVPHRTDTSSARLWVAALSSSPSEAPADVGLQVTGAGPGAGDGAAPAVRTVVLAGAAWRRVRAGDALAAEDRPVVHVQVAEVSGLRPGSRYTVRRDGAGEVARFSTLPAALPGPGGERPFTVLLSSCFYRGTDEEGLFGRAVQQLPAEYQPDIKVLCGDQVYLDIPVAEPLLPETRFLAANFLDKYARTFFQRDGFATVLPLGGTSFIADDHEFWNNYPTAAVLSSNTWTPEGRERWARVALALYREFQCDDPARAGRPRRFSIGGGGGGGADGDPAGRGGRLSFFIADTRVFREEDDGRFMRDDDHADLLRWLADLGDDTGPGVLVVGQPLLQERGSFLSRRVNDRVLADFRQYRELVRALLSARRSVLILTGDVHFGRVASLDLASGARLYEVISSPVSLVDRLVGGESRPAPQRFPPPQVGLVPRPVETLYQVTEEHFTTLQFSQRAGQAQVELRYWFPRAGAPSSRGAARQRAVGPLALP